MNVVDAYNALWGLIKRVELWFLIMMDYNTFVDGLFVQLEWGG